MKEKVKKDDEEKNPHRLTGYCPSV